MDAVLEQVEGIKTALTPLAGLPAQVRQIEDVVAELRAEVGKLGAREFVSDNEYRYPGKLTKRAAEQLGAFAIASYAATDRLHQVIPDAKLRDERYAEAKRILGINQKAALTTSEVYLPMQFGTELKELIADYGVVRNAMTKVPLGKGTLRMPRVSSTLQAFLVKAMSAQFLERTFTAGYADLSSHKYGDITVAPREILEQGAIDVGAYLGQAAARMFAKIEDTVGLLGDGTGTYESRYGVGPRLSLTLAANVKTLDAGETSPADVTIDDIRDLRTLISPAALNNGKYYFHTTMERHFRTLKTEADPEIFMYTPTGAKLDGFPIVWTNLLPAYTTSATVSSYLGFFGDMSWWWFGEHGSPRIDFSDQVRFEYDQVVWRFIEEIDFDYNDLDAVAALMTPAA